MVVSVGAGLSAGHGVPGPLGPGQQALENLGHDPALLRRAALADPGDEGLGELGELGVGVLGDLDQQRERFVGADVVVGDQDALGLPDRVPAAQGASQALDLLLQGGEPVLVGPDGRSGRVTVPMVLTVQMAGGVVRGSIGAG